jgi:hypothetical protein
MESNDPISEVDMKGMIVIENLTGRHLQYRIDHKAVCVKVGRCLCRKGRRSVEALTVHVPGFGRTAPIFSEVAQCPAIKAAASGNNPTLKIHGHEEKGRTKSATIGQGYTASRKASTGRKGQDKKETATD